MSSAPDRPSSPWWVWPLTFVIVTALFIGGAVYVFTSLLSVPGDVAKGGLEMFRELMASLGQREVVIRFQSYATEIQGSNRLQFATLEQMEIFDRRDESPLPWGELLPEVVVEARAPVTYTYYVDFDDPWQFEIEDRTVRVVAPRIQFNKPSIDASEIRFETRVSSVFRDEEAAMAELKAGLTQMSQVRARESIHLVRELGRAQIEGFVGNWLTQSFGSDDYHVQVLFADEVDGGEGRDRIRLREEIE